MAEATCDHGEPTVSSDVPPFEALARAEDRHFWFRGRNAVLRRVFRGLAPVLGKAPRILEVGCGTGNVLRVLEDVFRDGAVIGSDLHADGLDHARTRVRCPLVQADIHQLPFQEPFDLVGLFDVLEHLPDDRRVLEDLWRQLAPGGRLVLTVPAHAALWSYADEFAQHYRRYAPAQLRQALTAAGFEVEYLTQFMLPLLPLMWLGRRVSALVNWLGLGKKRRQDLWERELRIVPVVNGVLTWLLRLEGLLIGRRWRMPAGTSLLAVARKPAASAPLAA